MSRYLKRKSGEEESSIMNSNDPSTKISLEKPPLSSEPSKKSRVESEVPEFSSNPVSTQSLSIKNSSRSDHAEFNLPELPSDPGERPKIVEYDLIIREMVRRKYYLNGACQPRKHEFPQRDFNGKLRRFNPAWFDEVKWLEYSISNDSTFCLYCYLFKNEYGDQGGGDVFVSEGFRDWKKKDKLRKHEGGVTSVHKQAWSKCQDLMNQKQHIETSFSKMTEEARIDYRIRLNASIDCIRFLLRQGLPFRGHNEYDGSNNQGNFLELLKFLTDHNEEVRNVALKNAPENLKLIAPQIQKDIVRACAFETTNAIIRELSDELFSILLDESRDVSMKEQMAVVLRFVNKKGCVAERFLGLKHVISTPAQSLKNALEELFSAHGLSISMLCGQGYDGASNMRGKFNGLKTLILKENECAYYAHCFAHQLQLALVAVAKNHVLIATLFLLISNIVNVVGSSCKRRDTLREAQVARIIEGLENGEITNGRGLNPESTVIRPSDTRWGSHYGTLMSLINMFASVIDVLDVIVEEGTNSDQKAEALRLLKAMQSFEFVITLHLMKSILGITNDLSHALQRKEQDIGNAIVLVDISKKRLQAMRDNGWNSLVEEVFAFCVKHHICIPSMDDLYVVQGRSRRRAEEMTNSHHYRVELFNTVVDMQLQELNSRFNEVNTKLLLCVSSLNPSNSFAAFDKKKTIQLAQFYPKDFSDIELLALSDQLENFIMDMRLNVEFSGLKGLGDITQKMVENRRDVAYPLVYKLLTLILILPIATATVERAFSGMTIVKNRLRNRMGDELMNDCLVVYIEKDIFSSLSNESIMNYFQNMKNRRGQL